MPEDELYKLMFEGFDQRQYFQVAVVRAASAAEAEQRLRDFLARRGAKLVEIDPDETAIVREATVPPEWRVNGEDREGIVGMSGRVWVAPELFK